MPATNVAATHWRPWGNIRNIPGPLARGSSLVGQPLLPGILDPAARVIVEMAPGANIAASPDTWSWVDITADVMQASENGVSISPMGRADETQTAQPAQCAFSIWNVSLNYLNTPSSIYYPNIVRNIPIRVRINVGYGYYTRFQGNAIGFQPTWDTTGTFPVVSVTAYGVTLRLGQRGAPQHSALRTSIAANPKVVAYYPLEDSANTTRAAEVISNQNGGAGIEPPFGFGDATADTLYGSDDVATPHISAISRISAINGKLTYPSSFSPFDFLGGQGWSVTWLMNIPQQPSTVETILLELYSVDQVIAHMEVVLGTDGKMRIRSINSSGVDEFSDGGTTFNQFTQAGTGYNRWLQFSLYYTSTATRSTFFCTWEDELEIFFCSDTLSAGPSGNHLVNMPPSGFRVSAASYEQDEFSIGHLAFWQITPRIDTTYVGFGYKGEAALTRLARICSEQNVPLTVVSDGDDQPTLMGPQTKNKLMDNLREIEATEGGLLVDGRNPGVTYITRAARQSKRATLTLDATQKQIGDPFEPVDDDQRTRNRMETQNANGSNMTYIDSTSSLGTGVIGEYVGSVSVNLKDDTNTLNRSAWEVRRGTVPGMRYPTINLDLAARPELIGPWLNLELNGRVDVQNVSSVALGHPPGTLALLAEGWSENISPTQWTAQINCSPYDPYLVGQIQSVPDEFAWRLDTAGTTLAASAAAGATSLSIAVSDGYLWSTVAADYPRVVGINGFQVTVTGCSGGASPQTLTVQALPYAVTAGMAVSLWNPARLAL